MFHPKSKESSYYNRQVYCQACQSCNYYNDKEIRIEHMNYVDGEWHIVDCWYCAEDIIVKTIKR